MNIDSTLIFVDGENLSLRYHEMVKAGHIPAAGNKVVEDCFVWNQRVLDDHLWYVKRLSYYTSVVGDDVKVRRVREAISSTSYKYRMGDVTARGELTGWAQILPLVRKKDSKSRKESICDIAIAVDVMRACYRDHGDTIWVFTGDGDFIQLFEEIIHSGKRVYASAFSSGLNENIRYAVDEFIPLDKYFFVDRPKAQAVVKASAKSIEPKEPRPAKKV